MSDALDNIRMATGGGNVQRRPSLAVGLVDAGVLIQKEGHHVHAAIYAGLRGRKQEQVLGHCHTASLCSRMFEDAKDGKKKPTRMSTGYVHRGTAQTTSFQVGHQHRLSQQAPDGSV